ncbi:MAG TPA: helix-turn-helix domain-containing protein [Rhizomicrobium sp.]|jgi:transcriptional regulator with XRE-family HTH domain|nr:helix-turn-helix domain-containing protein [Rhizomicrobium sp.]
MSGNDPSIAVAVARLRKERKLSLAALAQLAGISRSMLHEIEKDRTNPTVGIAWRLATALRVDLPELLRGSVQSPIVDVIGEHATPWLTSEDGLCRLRILGPLQLAGHLEWYLLDAEPKGELVSSAHQPRTTEHLSVLKGELVVSVDNEDSIVPAGATIRYRADRPHAIRNRSKAPAEALLMVVL